jgi:hypothetical protein
VLNFLGNLFHPVYLWVQRCQIPIGVTVFRLDQGDQTELVLFEKLRMRWLGIVSIYHLRLPKTNEEIDEDIRIRRENGIPVWTRQVTPRQLDCYCARFRQKLDWRTEDMKLMFARNDSIVPGDLGPP